MTSAYSNSYAHPPPPNGRDDVRLPSIKDLNFPQHRAQEGSTAPSGGAQAEHARPSRHDAASWSRSSASTSAPPSQHPQSMLPPHESPKTQYPPAKVDATYANSQQPPPPPVAPNTSGPPPSRGDPSPQNPSKRPRSESGVGVSPSAGRSHATGYPPPHPSYASQPPPSYATAPPAPVPASHEPVHQSAPYPPPTGYAYPPPPVAHMPPRHYAVPPPVPPQHPASSYPPQAPPEHWPPHAPPPPPHQYAAFPRPALVATAGDPRSAALSPNEAEKFSFRQSTLSEIYKHCSILHQFSQYWAQLQSSQPQAQPSPHEVAEMTWRANTVMRLLEEVRRLSLPEGAAPKESAPAVAPAPGVPEDHTRPPKRPWEDMAREESDTPAPNSSYPDAPAQFETSDRATAEKDMEIIRSKRATSTNASAPGQPKSKYRKRSRATPPGKCHSCNIRETPEWRRGPDGARTLCNACGLHYAKLMRKRDKGADGKAAPIDLQTLRASTQSARGAEAEHSHSQSSSHHQQSPVIHAQYDQQKAGPPPPMHQSHHPPHPHPSPHPHSYQLMPVAAPPTSHSQMMPPPPPHQQGHGEGGPVPPPPWMTSSSSRTGYSTEHQSYLRTAHPPSHARASPQ
ncbi:uncharacterized protein B0H18DRAFT_1001097 [Fomitopsis serialis]|uniref:uncharacterized protein n=1 Tax=Fomitopsis serialis TaxID=139415 RepID=UPI002008CFA6|nr:uncharacterized protein B0H18DRAFT_1001097 [Neoantrodia serialis]KAH9928389.1 hypothetical protein B0H18DRAFT_1001097 [Neoantrodia serialis]